MNDPSNFIMGELVPGTHCNQETLKDSDRSLEVE